MKTPLLIAGVLATLALTLAGCAVAPSVRVHPIVASQPSVVDLDASARAIIILPRPDGKGNFVCSEPSPDVAMSAIASMVAQVKLANPNVDASTQAQFQTAVIDLAHRSQVLQFEREALFRLCEQSMNQNLSSDQIFQLYQVAMQTALKMAESELTKNKADLAKTLRDPEVRKLWNQLVEPTLSLPVNSALKKK